METTVIIPAGGVGKRYGADLPKQYSKISGKEVILYALEAFQHNKQIDNIVLTIAKEWQEYVKELIENNNITKFREFALPGVERQDSVYNALKTNTINQSDLVLVHDSVRPFISQDLINSVIKSADENGAVIPGLPPRDTIKEISGNEISQTLDRESLIRVQTPQAFWQELIITAYENAKKANFIGTDSASLVEFLGHKVYYVPGENENIKITDPIDRIIAENILKERNATS